MPIGTKMEHGNTRRVLSLCEHGQALKLAEAIAENLKGLGYGG